MSIFEHDRPQYSVGETIQRGYRAQQVLDDELFREAYEAAQWSLVEQWADQAGTLEHREACWAGLHAMEAIRNQLRIVVSEGDFAAKKDKS